jgi:hypothetical protein
MAILIGKEIVNLDQVKRRLAALNTILTRTYLYLARYLPKEPCRQTGIVSQSKAVGVS